MFIAPDQQVRMSNETLKKGYLFRSSLSFNVVDGFWPYCQGTRLEA